MRVRGWIGFTVVLITATTVIAQPIVQSVTGDFTDGTTIAIEGMGFGTKPTQQPYLWDTLSNQSGYVDRELQHGDIIPSTQGDWGLSPCPDCPWDVNQPNWTSPMRYWDQNHRVPGRPFYRVERKGYFRMSDWGDTLPDRVYLNWWFRTSAPDLTVGSNKFVRLWADTERPEGSVSWTGMHLTYTADANHDGVNDGGEGHVTTWGNWGGSSGSWHNLEMVYDGQGDIQHGYGTLRIYRDGRLVHAVNDAFGELPWNRLYVFGFDASVGEPFAGETFDFSDIYIDTSLARVVVGNAAQYANVTHQEVQIPQSWNTDSINVTVNSGSFAPSEDLWLFVFDVDGEVNPVGHSVTTPDIPDDGPPGMPGQPVRNI